MLMILLDDEQAASLRGPTGRGAALDPRRVDAGPHAGGWILPTEVLDDPAHEPCHATLTVLLIVEIDQTEAWPVVGEA
ncbi:hypothetical protein CLG96_00070 [Sphingomonas oleivorans]|uniref:Uncharacterized protein n=1 Tax=Sphingomonas oleivorans TaxID=1735121 RepID=A0A2T5G3A0_9SPHN|nr:hypothetical protein [Sphingomonas oleivorans]PTQ13716.1 hypothetical protein CLG96_00070 [Sphingomonas oleivorans]